MTDDRMERVREKAREAAHSSQELLDNSAGKEPGLINQIIGFEFGYVAGNEAATTLTDTEWAEMREKVGKDIHNQIAREVRAGFVDIEVHDGPASLNFETSLAEAAMRAVGLRKEGEQ